MLKHISWTEYLTLAGGLLVLYYLFIAFKYFRAELDLFKPGTRDDAESPRELPSALIYEEPVQDPVSAPRPDLSEVNEERALAQGQIQEADEFIGLLRSCIRDASVKTYAPDALARKLRELFSDHASFKDSPYRPAINEVVVTECERTGTALLTEDEVNRWWFT